MKGSMKIYIWENVLTAWTDGIAMAYASTLEEALDTFPDWIAERLGKPTMSVDCSASNVPFGKYRYGGD